MPPLPVIADQTRGLTSFDWVVVALYACGMLGMGLYYARGQNTTEDYFVGGGKLNSFAVGISLFATLLSTISYLSSPGEMIGKGPMIFTASLATPIAFVIVGYLLIPTIMRRRVTSAYELLEEQLGVVPRLLAATIFIAIRLVWMGLMLNLCAEALVHMLELKPEAQPWIVLIAGTIAVGYTVLGGLRAVVLTDLVQFLLLFGGAVLTIVLVTFSMGGFGWIPTEWSPHWDKQPLFSWDPHTRVTVVGSIISGVVWWTCTAGSDQTAIQRYMATGDAKKARRSFLVNACADVSVAVVLGLVGLAVLGFYSAHPELVTSAGGLKENADKLFPQYIANQLPVGISGLVVVALFAAVMSSVDSGINAVTAVVLVDYIGRFRQKDVDERSNLRFARVLALCIGAVIVYLNTVVDKVPGNYVEVATKTVNLLVAPLFSLFFMALFVRFSTPFGAFWGAIYGSAAAALVGYWDLITGSEPLSFLWIGPISLVVSVAVGVPLSLLPTRNGSPAVLCGLNLVAGVLMCVVFWAATQIEAWL